MMNEIAKDIYDSYVLEELKSIRRSHLGPSVIGDKCKRHVFYEFRWYKRSTIEGRILRLFDTGKREESRVIENLKAVGFIFRESDNQIRFTDKSGHVSGSVDGIIDFIPDKYQHAGPCILEIKTHSEKNFAKLGKTSVASSFPKHYKQMQYYMGAFDIPLSLYVAVNKNTDEIYIEFVQFDAFEFAYLKGVAEDTVLTEAIPKGISENPAWYECKFCNFYSICHENKAPDINCRTCKHSIATGAGSWGCKLLNQPLTFEDQVKACEKYESRT